MSDCNICCEKYNKKIRNKIKCEYCNFEACKVCYKKYLVDLKQTKCMSNECSNIWSLNFLYRNFSYIFTLNYTHCNLGLSLFSL
mgnify:CR=1 FL=1